MSEERWTIRRVLSWMRADFDKLGIPSPRLDAELLLAEVLACQRVQLYLDMERPLAAGELHAVRGLVKRRRSREPVAYILGTREFYGRPFGVDARVLIPRPDTELLVDEALRRLPAGTETVRVLDLCTGSGCVGLTLAAERPHATVDVTDCSAGALSVARENARALAVVERVGFFEGDLWAAVPDGRRYQLITCNPPYVGEREWDALAPDVREHEPRRALVAGDDGYAYYGPLSGRAQDYLAPGGALLLEVGAGQAARVEALCHRAGLTQIQLHRDLGGVMRLLSATAG